MLEIQWSKLHDRLIAHKGCINFEIIQHLSGIGHNLHIWITSEYHSSVTLYYIYYDTIIEAKEFSVKWLNELIRSLSYDEN